MPSRLRSVACRLVFLLACLIFAVSVGLLAVNLPTVVLLIAGAVAWRTRYRWRLSGSQGTATMTRAIELAKAKMLDDDPHGLIVGRVGFCDPPTRKEAVEALLSPRIDSSLACDIFAAAFFKSNQLRRRLIRLTNYVHLSTISPPGGGKSVSVLIPNLLSCPLPMVVIDPKGELYRATAAHRKKYFANRIIRIDPYHACGPGSDQFNPLEFIDDNDPALLEACRDVANLLVVRTGQERERHWDDKSESFISTFLYLICTGASEENRNFRNVRDILSSPDTFKWSRDKMRNDPERLLKTLGESLMWTIDRELGSVMSSVQRHTDFMDSPQIMQNLLKSTFDPRDLRSGRMTIYITLPADKLTVMQGWLRLVLGRILRIVTQRGANESNPILFMIDEAAHLGSGMRVLQDAVTLYRGMGLRLWLFWQALPQMKECFAENWEVVLSSMSTTQYFGLRDWESADAVSRRIGDTTIAVSTRNCSESWSRPYESYGPHSQSSTVSRSISWTTSEQARRLVKPEEILVKPDLFSFVFHQNMSVIPAQRVISYADPDFKRAGTGKPASPSLGVCLLALVTLAGSIWFFPFACSLVRTIRQQQRSVVSQPMYRTPAAPHVPPYPVPVQLVPGAASPPPGQQLAPAGPDINRPSLTPPQPPGASANRIHSR